MPTLIDRLLLPATNPLSEDKIAQVDSSGIQVDRHDPLATNLLSRVKISQVNKSLMVQISRLT